MPEVFLKPSAPAASILNNLVLFQQLGSYFRNELTGSTFIL
jgi:hypothetical protein